MLSSLVRREDLKETLDDRRHKDNGGQVEILGEKRQTFDGVRKPDVAGSKEETSMHNGIGKQFRKPSGIGGRIVSYVMKRGNRHAYDKLIPQLEVKGGDRILEIGYGHGIGIDMLCTKFDCRVTGVDFSELMFKEACKRNRKHCTTGRAILHCGDYLDFTEAGGEFDSIIVINVIYFWRDLLAPFGKMYSELKPGGTVCFFMAHRDDLNKLKFTTDDVFCKYTIEQVTEVMQRAGFEEISYVFDKGYIVKARR